MENVKVINIMADGTIRNGLSGYFQDKKIPDITASIVSDLVKSRLSECEEEK